LFNCLTEPDTARSGVDLMPIKVSIVEDNQGTRQTLARLLASSPALCITGAYRDAEQALQKIPAEQPDVVLWISTCLV